jgi:molecular chaperone GrpE
MADGKRTGKQTLEEQSVTPGANASGAAASGAGASAGAAGHDGERPAGKPHEPAPEERAGACAPGCDEGAAEVQGDLDELLTTAAQRDEYLALAQRTQADFENYRKRVARDSAAAQERGIASLAKELLPALDNLDRALGEAGTAGTRAEDDPLLQGVRLVRSELSAALARAGIESFSPVGEVFDPSLHEAVATEQQSSNGGAQSGTVVEVFQPGYRLGASVIRPARVVVAA